MQLILRLILVISAVEEDLGCLKDEVTLKRRAPVIVFFKPCGCRRELDLQCI